jgi:hypothetical protein
MKPTNRLRSGWFNACFQSSPVFLVGMAAGVLAFLVESVAAFLS